MQAGSVLDSHPSRRPTLRRTTQESLARFDGTTRSLAFLYLRRLFPSTSRNEHDSHLDFPSAQLFDQSARRGHEYAGVCREIE